MVFFAGCSSLVPLQPRAASGPVGIDLPAPSRSDREYFAVRALMVPVAGVAPSRLRDSYNEARSDGRTHRALDIPAPRGMPVLAAVDGTIIALRQNALGGTTLYLVDSDHRFVYYYAHLQNYADRVTEGLEVAQGDVLGYVGTSGNARPNAPHLHFQALRVAGSRRDWWNGESVDVRSFFTLAGKERRL